MRKNRLAINCSDIIVIGGGPAGLLASIAAARQGADVLLLEKMGSVGKKLLITGKGRCNLTNSGPEQDFFSKYPRNGNFLRSAINSFGNQDLMKFMGKLGIPLVTERGGRVFPADGKAQAVVEALTADAKAAGVEIRNSEKVQALIWEANPPRVQGVKSMLRKYSARAVVLATGGASYPLTGSTGDGYDIAAACGHSIQPLRAALVPIELMETWIPPLQGLSLRNVRMSAYYGNKKIAEEFGEMLFTHFGLSGPIVLTISSFLREYWDDARKIKLELNLKPGLSLAQLEQRIERERLELGKKEFQTLVAGYVPRALVTILVGLSEIEPKKKVSQITKTEISRFLHLLQHVPLTIKKPRPLAEAIVTAGGISTKEINPKTMESRLCQGLYFAGEIIDVDGVTGGYNLQAAFSTGYLAGLSAARYCRDQKNFMGGGEVQFGSESNERMHEQ